MFCQKCGEPIGEHVKFCPKCGAPNQQPKTASGGPAQPEGASAVHEAGRARTGEQPAPFGGEPKQTGSGERKKPGAGKKRGLAVGVGVLIVLLAAAGGVFAARKISDGKIVGNLQGERESIGAVINGYGFEEVSEYRKFLESCDRAIRNGDTEACKKLSGQMQDVEEQADKLNKLLEETKKKKKEYESGAVAFGAADQEEYVRLKADLDMGLQEKNYSQLKDAADAMDEFMAREKARPEEETAAETAAANAEPAEKVRVSKEEVEDEVLKVRQCWNTDMDQRSRYDAKTVGDGATAYFDGNGQLVLVELENPYNGAEGSATLEYRAGKLIFFYAELKDVESLEEFQMRCYFKDGCMFRADMRIDSATVLYDAEYGDEGYLELESSLSAVGQEIYRQIAEGGILRDSPEDIFERLWEVSDGRPDESGNADGASGEAVLISAAEADLSSAYLLSYASCGESSHIRQENYDNTAGAAMDGDEVTSWQEGADGEGIGEYVWYDFGGDYDFRYVSIKAGNWRNAGYYQANHRPRRLTIKSDSGFESTVELPDGRSENWVKLPDSCTGTTMSFTIESVYEGNGDYEDTCIAEIGVYGEYRG